MEENHIRHLLDTQQNVLMSLHSKTQKSCLCIFEFYLLILTRLIFSNDIINDFEHLCIVFCPQMFLCQSKQLLHGLFYYSSSRFWIQKDIIHSKTLLSPSPAIHNKVEKICHTMEVKIKRREGKRKSCKLAKGSSTDRLPTHNSKTMSNKKLSKSNFHCHPHFSRSHLPSSVAHLTCAERLAFKPKTAERFHRAKTTHVQTLGSNNPRFDTGEWTYNQWMWPISVQQWGPGPRWLRNQSSGLKVITLEICLLPSLW